MASLNLDDIPDETCSWCGKGFSGISVIQKYCCYQCQRASLRKFRSEIEAEERRRKNSGKTCLHCGAVFDGINGHSLYCSASCRREFYYAARKQAEEPNTERRLAQLAALECTRCGDRIPNARSTLRMYCSPCYQTVKRERDAARSPRLRHLR